MKYKLLKTRNPNMDPQLLLDIIGLYKGGKDFRSRIRRYLPKAKSDDDVKYQQKIEIGRDEYRNYLSTVINYYSGFLFSNPIHVRAMTDETSAKDLPDFYSLFKDDCDGARTDFHDFLKARFTEALLAGSSVWAVQFPNADVNVKTLLDWEKAGLDRATVHAFSPVSLYDYEHDDAGNLLWCILGETESYRATPLEGRNSIRERFWIYDRQNITQLEVSYKATFASSNEGGYYLNAPASHGDTGSIEYFEGMPNGTSMHAPNGETEIPVVSQVAHNFGRVPVVIMHLNDWIGKQVAPLQIANLRARVRLAFALNTAAYPRPVLSTDDEDCKSIATSGDAIIIGTEDKFSYTTPPDSSVPAMADDVKDTQEELFRVANLNHLAMKSNSFALVRSAASRLLDRDQGHVTLKSMASAIKEAAEQTMQLISEGRGEKYNWQAEDLEQLDSMNLPEWTEVLEKNNKLGIPSETFRKEIYKKYVAKFGPDFPEKVKQDIRDEIDSAALDLEPKDQPIEDDKLPPDSAVDENSLKKTGGSSEQQTTKLN